MHLRNKVANAKFKDGKTLYLDSSARHDCKTAPTDLHALPAEGKYLGLHQTHT